MKFRLPRALLSPEVSKILSREIKKKNVSVARTTKKDLQEISEVLKDFERHDLPPQFVRKKLMHDLGHGIFLRPDAKPILKGQVIAPYAGEISIVPQNAPDESNYAFGLASDMHLNRKEQFFLDKKLKFHPGRLYSMKLDALKKGNFTRFINHSEKPNVIAHLVSIRPNSYGLTPTPLEIVYFAKKTIKPGEQLLVSYEEGEKSFWGAMKIKPFHMTPKTFRLSKDLKVCSDS